MLRNTNQSIDRSVGRCHFKSINWLEAWEFGENALFSVKYVYLYANVELNT